MPRVLAHAGILETKKCWASIRTDAQSSSLHLAEGMLVRIKVYIHMNTRPINGPLLFVSLHSDMRGTCAVPPCPGQNVQYQSRVFSVSIWRYEGCRRVSCFAPTLNTR